MGRVGLSSGIVIQEAVRLADQRGLSNLTMAALARRLSVALPSLYAHVRNGDQLRRSIAAVGSNELAVRLGAAVQGRVRFE
ncbi:MAG: TetR family transcriptional regulator, partial [Clostridia bacterium]|nr:TetR family transcriptional regulator [Deltaproteobacteria bacterium]